MNRIWLSFIASIVLSIGAVGSIPSEAGAESPEIELTEEQKDEMASLQKEAFNQKKEIINKYVEYGVYTEEKGEKIISHLDEMYTKLEENGFILKWEKKYKKNND